GGAAGGGSAGCAGRSSSRGEQRHRKNHLLGADAAVQEAAAVARLVLAQLGGIHEEDVFQRDQVVGGLPPRRKAQPPRIVRGVRGGGVLGAQVVAELVAQVLRGVAL